MSYMFAEASDFNQDINYDSANNYWNTSNVVGFAEMFNGATNFNGDISNWDTSSAEDMSWMFEFATSFSGDLSEWDMSSVTDIRGMFNWATSFNSDISGWDTSLVEDMSYTFRNAALFNQDLSNWNISNLWDAERFIDGTNMSVLNYSKLLRSWANQPHQSGGLGDEIRLGVGPAYYETVESDRQLLLDDYWEITDGGSTAASNPTILGTPTASSITSGQNLSLSILSGGMGSTPGLFAFTTPNYVPGVGTNSQSVTFTPSNDIEYNSVALNVPVEVTSAPVPPVPSPTPNTNTDVTALATTGYDIGNKLPLGWVLLLAGVVLVGISRRNSRKKAE